MIRDDNLRILPFLSSRVPINKMCFENFQVQRLEDNTMIHHPFQLVPFTRSTHLPDSLFLIQASKESLTAPTELQKLGEFSVKMLSAALLYNIQLKVFSIISLTLLPVFNHSAANESIACTKAEKNPEPIARLKMQHKVLNTPKIFIKMCLPGELAA